MFPPEVETVYTYYVKPTSAGYARHLGSAGSKYIDLYLRTLELVAHPALVPEVAVGVDRAQISCRVEPVHVKGLFAQAATDGPHHVPAPEPELPACARRPLDPRL